MDGILITSNCSGMVSVVVQGIDGLPALCGGALAGSQGCRWAVIESTKRLKEISFHASESLLLLEKKEQLPRLKGRGVIKRKDECHRF